MIDWWINCFELWFTPSRQYFCQILAVGIICNDRFWKLDIWIGFKLVLSIPLISENQKVEIQWALLGSLVVLKIYWKWGHMDITWPAIEIFFILVKINVYIFIFFLDRFVIIQLWYRYYLTRMLYWKHTDQITFRRF